MNPIVRLRARIIQFAKRQLHGTTKCRVSGKRKRRPAGIKILCCTATVFSRLNTAAGICVTEMFEICQATFVFVWCVCVCLWVGEGCLYTWIGHILRRNCLLKHVIEWKKGREDEEEDIDSYLTTLSKREDTGI